MKGLFSLTYLGPVSYYRDMMASTSMFVEACESWQKQSYRNRCYIDGPNGPLMLNIPIVHQGSKQLYSDVLISYKDNWPAKHWQAIQTSYNSSPFFEVLGPDLKALLDKKTPKLFDLNKELTSLIFKWLRVISEVTYTTEWKSDFEDGIDFRESHHPKRKPTAELLPYPQVFDSKHGFSPNMSIIDLLFNEGPAAFDLLIHT